MRFHFFRPLHGWREFIHEVVIVVIGVMLALAGAQLIETLQKKSTAAETRDEVWSVALIRRTAMTAPPKRSTIFRSAHRLVRSPDARGG